MKSALKIFLLLPVIFNFAAVNAQGSNNKVKLTVNSQFTGGWFKGDNEVASAVLYLNRQKKYEFSQNSPEFSEELNEGEHFLEVCESHLFGERLRCLEMRISLQKNTHVFILHKENRAITGTTRNLSHIRTVKLQDLPLPVEIPNKEKINAQTPDKKPNVSSMEEARKKCIELGFKQNTESFGNCILKLSN